LPYLTKSSFFRVLAALTTFLPPMWQEAQLALKIEAPSAKAGRAIPNVTTAKSKHREINSLFTIGSPLFLKKFPNHGQKKLVFLSKDKLSNLV
jgi:hypothetical protein